MSGWRVLAALMLSVIFGGTPVCAEWRRAESPNFILYGQLSERALRDRILLLEDFDRLLRIATTVNEAPAPNRLAIYIVRGARELRAIRAVPPGVGGFYTATPEGIAAFVDGGTRAEENQILFHEYAHHFMMQYRPNAYPAWYVEGFAEYFMTARLEARRIDIGDYSAGRAYLLTSGGWLPMARVLAGDRAGLSQEDVARFYAQSWLLVHYFYSNPERQATLTNFLRASRDDDPAAALASATGFTSDQLAAELRRYIGAGTIRFRRMARDAVQVTPAVTITTLSPAADDLMIDSATLRIGVGEDYQPAALARIRAAAARYPDDAFARRTLAHAEALFGDAAAADRLLAALLAATPGDAELLYLNGRRHLAAANSDNPPANAARTARDWFGRAHRADANHFQTLYRYAESMRGERAYVSENTSNILELAHELAPQVHEITMNAAQMLITRGENAEAARMLAPLAADPHNPGLARAAREMLERAGARSQTSASPSPQAPPTQPR